MPTLNLGFLASHGGSNVQAIIDAIKSGNLNAKPCCLISNNSNSYALRRAENEGIPAYHISQISYPDENALNRAIIDKFDEYGVDTLILAGYMKILGAEIIRYYKGKVLNIHPALLPKFGGKGMYGKYVHEAVLKSGEKKSGATVHLVDELYDHGRILAQSEIPVYPDDTIEKLAARVLEQEHILYPETLQRISEGIIKI